MAGEYARATIPRLSRTEIEEGARLIREGLVRERVEPIALRIRAMRQIDEIVTEKFGTSGRNELAEYMASKVSPFHLDYYSMVANAVADMGIEDSPRLQVFISKVENAPTVTRVKSLVDNLQSERLNASEATMFDTVLGFIPGVIRRRLPGPPLPLGGPVTSVEGRHQVVGIEGNRRTEVRPEGVAPREALPEETLIRGPLLQGDSPHTLEVAFAPGKKPGVGMVTNWMMYVTEGCRVRRFWIPVGFGSVLLPKDAGKRLRFRLAPDEDNTIAWRCQPIGLNTGNATVRRVG